jgi:hypothetical protein
MLKLLLKMAFVLSFRGRQIPHLAFPQQVAFVLRQQPCPMLNEQPGVGSFDHDNGGAGGFSPEA